MFSGLLFLCVVTPALAGMKNSATFGKTVLKYYVGEQDTTIFGTALVSCIQSGGELVMPKDKKLNDAVASVTKGTPAWIGGGDLFGEGNYEWIDGKRHEWTYWREGEPNDHGDGEDCILIGGGGRWFDHGCCTEWGYVCQIHKFLTLTLVE